MDERAHQPVDRDAAEERRDAEERCIIQPGGGNAGREADVGADAEVEVVHREDEHLRQRRKGDRDSEVEEEVEPEIAHRPRLEVEDRPEQDRERQRGEGGAQEARDGGAVHGRVTRSLMRWRTRLAGRLPR